MSSQNEGMTLQCDLPALAMLLPCNSVVSSCMTCMVIMPLRPSSPLSAASSSMSVIAFTLATLSRIGSMCDISGISIVRSPSNLCIFILSLMNSHFDMETIMKTFLITIRTASSVLRYHSLAHSSVDAITDAIDCFGVATISAVPAKRGTHV
jgi:hypothetical protein